MKDKSLIYIISDSGSRDKIIAYEWYAKYFKNKYDLSFIILKGNDYLCDVLNSMNIKYKYMNYSGKNRLEVIKAIIDLFFFFIKKRPDIVHTHYYDASFIGLIAAKLAFIKKRIFTRHHGYGNHLYSLTSVKYDKIINKLATNVIAISEVVRKLLLFEGTLEKKITKIYHGFNFEEMRNIPKTKVDAIRKKYDIPLNETVIGVISSYQLLKGIQFIIPAFSKYLKIDPSAVLILANAYGQDEKVIKKLLKCIPIKNYREIIYENDIFSLYQTFSLFIHTPINQYVEAFGQVYVEALGCGIPSIFTLSGIAPEFIKHKENAFVVDFENSNQILDAMIMIKNQPDLVEKIKKNGLTDVLQTFDIEKMLDKMDELYMLS